LAFAKATVASESDFLVEGLFLGVLPLFKAGEPGEDSIMAVSPSRDADLGRRMPGLPAMDVGDMECKMGVRERL
jgi:hypothetical protein